MSEHYSPLRYPGGKAKLGDFLIRVIRSNGFIEPEYVEPYAGGAAVALRLLFEEYVDSIVINDADPRVYCFWKAVAEQTGEFKDRVRATPASVDEWFRQREIYRESDLDKPFELGFAMFYLNRTTRSGIVHNGGPIGGYDQTGNYLINARYNPEELVRRIHRIGVYADRIDLSCCDGLELLQGIAEDSDRARNVFAYLDPPYFDKGRELYMNHFTPAEHEALASFLGGDPGFAWVLTYDDVEAIGSLYAELPNVRFGLSYSAHTRKEGSELLVHPPDVEVSPAHLELLPFLTGDRGLRQTSAFEA